MPELKIQPVVQRNREHLVELLTSLVERVKAGEFDAMTILADKAESERVIVFEAGTFDVATRLGRIRILEAEILKDLLGG